MNSYQLGALTGNPVLAGYLMRKFGMNNDTQQTESIKKDGQNQGINEILENNQGNVGENQETANTETQGNSMLSNTAGAVGLGLGAIGSALKDRNKYIYYARG